MFEKHLHLTARVIGANIVSLGTGVGGGYWLDSFFDTKPLFLIFGVLFAFVAGQILVVWSIKGITRNDGLN